MTNQYPGSCRRCGQHVPAGAGTCTKADGRWVVEHARCTGAQVSAAPKPKAKPKAPKTYPEGAQHVQRRSSGRDDRYAIGDVLYVAKVAGGGGDGHVWRVIDAGKVRDDDYDEWYCTAVIVPATEAEAEPVLVRRAERHAAQAQADALAAELKASRRGDTDPRLYHAPADAQDIWSDVRPAGSDRWMRSPSTGIVYYLESSYDDGPSCWPTVATVEQVLALQATGRYRPNLLATK